MSKRLEISRDIAAPPELVYAAISDVTRMGEWSEECHACEWHEGFDGPVVGATFDGHNRHGEHEWITQGKVIEADPGRALTITHPGRTAAAPSTAVIASFVCSAHSSGWSSSTWRAPSSV